MGPIVRTNRCPQGRWAIARQREAGAATFPAKTGTRAINAASSQNLRVTFARVFHTGALFIELHHVSSVAKNTLKLLGGVLFSQVIQRG